MSDQKGAFNNSKKVSVIRLFVYAYTSKISTLFHTHKAQFFFQPAEGVILWQKATNVRFIYRNWYYYKLWSNLKAKGGGDGKKSILRAIFLTSYYFPRILHLQWYPPPFLVNSYRGLTGLAWSSMPPFEKKWKYRENIMVALRLVQSIQNTLSLAKMGDHNTHLSKGP